MKPTLRLPLSSALLFLSILSLSMRVMAIPATWSAVPGTNDWNTGSNWTDGSIPDTSAIFVTSTITGISISGDTAVGGITFNSGASAFTLTVAASDPTTTLTISSAGISNNSGITQNLVASSDQGYNFGFGTISFTNSSTAASSTTFTNQGSTFASVASNPYSLYGGGITQFFNTSQAGGATFINHGGSGNSYAGGGGTIFHDSASASTGTFTNKGGVDVAAYGGVTMFNNMTKAGSAHFTNEGGPIVATRGGYTVFNDTSSAETGTFTSNGGVASGTMGVTVFNNSASAGSADFIANGGVGLVADDPSGGYVIFNDTATAGSGSFTINGSALSGVEGGNTQFWGGTTAANGNFTINGGTLNDAGGGYLYFTNYVAGYGSTTTGATADQGIFTINGGGANGASGGYISFENAKAAVGDFTTNGGTASGAGGGYIAFYGSSTADNGTFTTNGGTASGIDGAANGGVMSFNQTSDAANSTLIANGGTNGGKGGSIQFFNSATGGNAIVKVYGNGNLDISPKNLYLSPVSVTIDSIEGSGNVFLGNNNLTVGGNNLSSIFSGVLQNSGRYGSGGNGSLTKTGTATLTLSGSNTYTGITTVSSGTLLVNGDQSAATGAVTIANGAILGGSGIIGGETTISSGGSLLPGNSPGLLTFNNGLKLDNGSDTYFELNGTGRGSTYDAINVTLGTLTYGGTLHLNFGTQFPNGTSLTLFDPTGANVASVNLFTVVDTGFGYADSWTNNSGIWTSTSIVNSQLLTFVENTGILTFSVATVPEPSSYTTTMVLVSLLVITYRRRKVTTDAG